MSTNLTQILQRTLNKLTQRWTRLPAACKCHSQALMPRLQEGLPPLASPADRLPFLWLPLRSQAEESQQPHNIGSAESGGKVSTSGLLWLAYHPVSCVDAALRREHLAYFHICWSGSICALPAMLPQPRYLIEKSLVHSWSKNCNLFSMMWICRQQRSSLAGEKGGRPSLLSRLSVGVTDALHSLGITKPQDLDRYEGSALTATVPKGHFCRAITSVLSFKRVIHVHTRVIHV